jgi:single-strand DNA-binding protein
MAGVNKVILIGNLGKDPIVRNLESGTKVVSFSLATTESYKNKNGEKTDITVWHNIELWRGLAEIAEKFLKKGSTIFLEGRIRNDSWTDKEGNNRTTVKIVGDNFQMLGSRKDAGAPAGNGQGSPVEHTDHIEPSEPAPAQEDDLPF